MAFSDGIKDFFGISTVKVEIDCPARFSIEQESIQGRLTLTGLRDQEICEVKMQFVEEWTDYEDGSSDEHRAVRGTDLLLNQTILLKKDEQICCDFDVPFELPWTLNDEMKTKDGVVGTIGKVASFLSFDDVLPDGVADVASAVFSDDRDVTYKIVALVDLRSTWADPDCEKILYRVDWGPLKG
jgi:hypothetical protein